MKKILFIWTALIITCLHVWANDKVSFTASAPDAVAVGDQFRLSYTVTTQEVRNFQVPSIKGFDVLMGPSRSTQRNVQVINGKTTSTSSITFTYILMAKAEGEYTIPGASITADGNQMISNAVTIKVIPADKAAASQGGGNGNVSTSGRQGKTIAKDDLFITATVNKTKVYEQEAFLLTYKIYTAVDLRMFENVKLPDFKGFHSQEVELPNNRRWGLEHYKGRNYQTTIYRQFVLFPQQTGKLTIDAARFDASVAVVSNQSMDPFDAFFNGGGYIEVKKKIVTPKVTINVKPLPAKPDNFSGGVGGFTLSSSINAKEVKTNDAVTIKLTIKGAGNMKLINTPEVKFPEDFEIYDPKVTNNFDVSRAGLSGTQTIEYLAIPRHAGDFTIPQVEFTYFDLKSQAYKTLKTEEYHLKVAKGKGNADQVIADFTNKENVKVLGQDVRFIKLGDTELLPKGKVFFGTTGYWLGYIIPFIIFVVLVIFFRKQAAENANIAKVKTKKANKVATKRMKLAGKLLAENKKNEFYDEVLKALWGYISDKLSIPVSQLSKDNIEAELMRYGVSDEVTKTFIDALNECEFARYAPGNENEAMDKVYAASVEAISKMENSIKH